MTPLKTPLVLAVSLLFCATLSRAASTYDASWDKDAVSGVDAARDRVQKLQSDRAAMPPAKAAGEPAGCMEFGTHVDALPEIDILDPWRPYGSNVPPMCRNDPFASQAEFETAWQQLRNRVVANDPRLVPYGAITGEKGFQKAIGRGLGKMDEVSAEKFWGDIEVVWLREDAQNARTTEEIADTARGTTVVTYRAYLDKGWGNTPHLKAMRFEFHADRHGGLDLVQRTSAEISPPATVINWGDSVSEDAGNAVVIYRWHQLVDALNRGL